MTHNSRLLFIFSLFCLTFIGLVLLSSHLRPLPQSVRVEVPVPITVEVPVPSPPVTIWALMDAITTVESNGNPSAIGDGGAAVGPLQIHPIMVRDCNLILGTPFFTLADRTSLSASQQMFLLYTLHYSYGEPASVIARRWNGGPDGDTKPSTLPYWEKVNALLQPTP